MNEDIELRPLGDIQSREDLHIIPRDEVERRAAKAEYWFEIAKDTRDVRDEIAHDLETALNACSSYQRVLALLEMPDPYLVQIRKLLKKYGMEYTAPSRANRIYVDGRDITEHPDSIPGSVVDDYAEIPTAITMELVQTEDGEMHWILGEDDDNDGDIEDPWIPSSAEVERWEDEGGLTRDAE